MANIIKKVAFGLLERIVTPSHVVAVRAWQPATMYEIDLHLPAVDMHKWSSIQRLKCKVSDCEYRDYTPALWNAAKSTCTMYVEAGHKGAGSSWAKHIKAGDDLILGAAHAASLPGLPGSILCIGDGSAIGHFLTLKQLTDRDKHPLKAGIFLHDEYEIPATLSESNGDMEFILQAQPGNMQLMEQWIEAKALNNYSYVYLAGNIKMVSALRKKLKAATGVHAKIYAHGFWS